MIPNASAHDEHEQLLHRREAIKRVSALFGGVALVGGSALWSACTGERAPGSTASGTSAPLFTANEVALLDEIADTILPTTPKSPGAKAAKVGPFIALMVTDCYSPADQGVFRRGLQSLDDACRAAHSQSFVNATASQRLALLVELDREAKQYMDRRTSDAPSHYFRMVKELTLFGYFTSEIGATKALRYVESPGRFDPCVPYVAGDPSWASHA